MTTTNINWAEGQEVLNTLSRYAWGVDTIDRELLGSSFAESGRTHGVIAGTDRGWGPWQGREEIVSQLAAIRNDAADIRRHQISTPLIVTLTEREAVIKAYLSVFSTTEDAKPRLVTTGEYVAYLSKIDGQWLIDNLEAVLDADF